MGTVHLVTGGFYGVGETVGKSFHSERQRMNESPNVWHILPTRDDKVCHQLISYHLINVQSSPITITGN